METDAEDLSTGKPIEIVSADGQIVLKQFTPGDAQKIFDLIDRNREHLSQFGDDTASKYPTYESVFESIVHPKNPKRLRFGIYNMAGEFVGSINLTPDEDRPTRGEVGTYLGSKFQGKGYALRALNTLTNWAFHNGYEELYGHTAKDNVRSAKVLIKAGFKESGVTKEGKIIYFLASK